MLALWVLSEWWISSIYFIWNFFIWIYKRTCYCSRCILVSICLNSIDTRDAWQGSSLSVSLRRSGGSQVQLSNAGPIWTQRGLRDSASDFNDQITIVPFHVRSACSQTILKKILVILLTWYLVILNNSNFSRVTDYEVVLWPNPFNRNQLNAW